MSDYLSRAAERASGVPGVRPALPSAFDPERSFSAPADNTSFAPVEVEAENDLRVQSSSDPAVADQAVSVRERIAAVEALWTQPPKEAPAQRRESGAKQTSPGVMGAPVVAREVATNPVTSEPDAPENAAVSPQSKNTISRSGPTTDSFSPPAFSPLAEKPTVTLSAEPTEPARDAPPPPVIGKPIAPRPTSVRVSPLTPRRIFPKRKAGPKSQPSPDPFTADDDNAPLSAGAIHVTIGRVEVRAIHPPAEPTPPRPPPKPTLSLDDYLKQRNGGARE
jgi:hypothetical protein